MTSSPARVGFIGLGNLGLPMALRLVDEGFSVVAYDISSERVRQIEDAGGTAGEARDAAACPTLCVATPDEQVLRALLDDGTIWSSSGVKTILLHSTVLPTAARALAADLAVAGIALLEVPVSGGPVLARTGDLTLLLGGDQKSLKGADAVLQALGRRRIALGGVGAASAVKLANQLVFFAAVDALHEGLRLTKTFDVETSAALEALSAGTGDTFAGRNWGFFDDLVRDYDQSGSAEQDRPWRKDLREFIAAAHAVSLPAPLGEHLLASVGDRIETEARANLEGQRS